MLPKRTGLAPIFQFAFLSCAFFYAINYTKYGNYSIIAANEIRSARGKSELFILFYSEPSQLQVPLVKDVFLSTSKY
jgi:hypothetical protein